MRISLSQVPCLALITVGLSIAPPASADVGNRQGGGVVGDFWQEIAYPGHKLYQQELRKALRFEAQARSYEQQRRSKLARRLYEDALAAYRRALAARKDGAQAHRYMGRVLFRLGRYKEGMTAVSRARQLSAAVRNDVDLAFEMGIAYSKLGKFRRAVEEYDILERVARKGLRVSSGLRATAHANAAESLMALGRLDEAIQRYRASLAFFSGSPLTYWGLGVALDRDEQVSKAMDAIRRALRHRKGLGVLTSPTVFFVPKGDIHYYYGLGYLAQGKLDEARKSFERFVKLLPKSQWAFRARVHLAELGSKRGRASGGKKKRLAPTPGPESASVDRVARDRKRYRNAVRSSLYYYLRSCYRRVLRGKTKGLSGVLRVRFTVAAKRPRAGYPKKVAIIGGTIRSNTMRQCVLKSIRSRYFGRPSSDKDVTVVVPIQFRKN